MSKKPVKHSDHSYIIGLLNNDSAIIKEIYNRCGNIITKMVISNKGSAEDAKDLLQDALIKIYSQAKDGFVLTCPLEGFVYLVCKRLWINKLKKNKNIKTNANFEDNFDISNIITDIDISYEDREIENSRVELMMLKFKEMGPSCQAILKLYWQKNEKGKYFSLVEISEKLSLSYPYLRKKISECKKTLIKKVRTDSKFKDLAYE